MYMLGQVQWSAFIILKDIPQYTRNPATTFTVWYPALVQSAMSYLPALPPCSAQQNRNYEEVV